MPIQFPSGSMPPLGGQGGNIGRPGLRLRGYRRRRSFTQASFTIAGVTRDADGVPVANCVVELFETGTDTKLASTTSDGSGAYSFSIGTNSGNFYVVAYKTGPPDRFGTTVQTLVAT